MSLEPGTVLHGLTIERELGRGAFGVVYLARDVLLEREVALKVIQAGPEGISAAVRGELLAEARIVGNLVSSHIAVLYGVHDDPDHGILLEMELLTGGELEDRVSEGRALPLDEAVRVFRGVCEALEAAHAARVIHGDVKPANVLFDGEDRPKLADFGIARRLKGGARTIDLHGKVLGSPLYMSPEVLSGETTGPGADVWSACVMFQQLLTGQVSFPAETLPQLMAGILTGEPQPLPDDIPKPYADVVRAGLTKDTSRRPARAGELLDLLDGAYEDVTSEGRIVTNIGPAAAPCVGREAELERIRRLFFEDDVRLITITGPPGIGKSCLVREAGRRLLGDHPSGVWFVDLSEAEFVRDVVAAVTAALPSTPRQLTRPALLVLDGFEHAAEAVAHALGAWLRTAVHLRVIAARRSPLRIGGERRLELSGLIEEGVAEMLESRGVAWHAELREEALRVLHGNPLGIVAAIRAGDDIEAGRAELLLRVRDWVVALDSYERIALRFAAAHPGGFSMDQAEEGIVLPDEPDAPFAFDLVQDLRDRGLLLAVEEGDETRFCLIPLLGMEAEKPEA